MSYRLSELNEKGVPSLLEGIERADDWRTKMARTREVWLEYVGGIPEPVPTSYEVTSEVREADHVRRHVIYRTSHGDAVTAFLLVPNAVAEGRIDTRSPAVMALHPTYPTGKERIASTGGGENRMYALELVARGYVVLAPDLMGAGERVFDGYRAYDSAPFYEAWPEWSTVGKNIVDHRHGVDLLCGLDVVDPERIGAIGHSFGGYNAYFLATMDPRIKAIVSSCGFSPFTGDPHPQHWGHREYWYTHLPKVTADLEADRVPFEFHEIVALCAPTPFFNYSAQSDAIFPHWEAVAQAMLDLHRAYAWLGSEDRFLSLLGAGAHDFPPLVREAAYGFLDAWLR